MQAITIGTAEGIWEIQERLDEELRDLQEEGVNIRLGLTNRGSFTFVDCMVDGEPGTRAVSEASVRHHVASALSDVIVEKWEQQLIKKAIKSTYYYFTTEEQEAIARYTGRNLAENGGAGDNGPLYRLTRKAQIMHRLRDYLEGSDELVLEGFITFRLRDYVEELEDAVDRAVDDYLMEREYREFVRLLKYFVDVQEPRMDHVHVLIRPGGSFKLVDDQGSAIKSEYLEEFVVEMVDSEVNYEDLLISALITLAPRAVTVHTHVTGEWDESIETIKGVFGDRVTFCESCPVCTTPAPTLEDPSHATTHLSI